jgi:hypothetical protein
MKTIVGILMGMSLFTVSRSAFGLTTEQDITPDYLSSHPDEFSVKVNKEENGLIAFELQHNVSRPMYHVVHLAVMKEGKILADSSTPTFGKMHNNIFYFSISPDGLPESKIDLSDSAFVGSGEQATPVPGTTVHRFRLIDFVPKKLLESATK